MMETKYSTVSTVGEICEIIYSPKGNHKIKARDYLMVKERNRNDLYYWCCVKNKSENCKGRVTTILINQQHYIKKFVNHNHRPTEDVETKVKTQVQDLKDILIFQTDAIPNSDMPTKDVLTFDNFSSSLNSNIKIESETEIHQDPLRFSPRSSDVTGGSIRELDYVPLCTTKTKEDFVANTDIGAPNSSTNISYIKSLCNILECEMLQMPADIIEECKDEVMDLIMRKRRKVRERKEIDET